MSKVCLRLNVQQRLLAHFQLQIEHFSAEFGFKSHFFSSDPVSGVDGWRLMLVSAARVSMSQGSTRVFVFSANRSCPEASSATQTTNRSASLPPKGPAPFEWRHRVKRRNVCQKVEGERFVCHYGQKCVDFTQKHKINRRLKEFKSGFKVLSRRKTKRDAGNKTN